MIIRLQLDNQYIEVWSSVCKCIINISKYDPTVSVLSLCFQSVWICLAINPYSRACGSSIPFICPFVVLLAFLVITIVSRPGLAGKELYGRVQFAFIIYLRYHARMHTHRITHARAQPQHAWTHARTRMEDKHTDTQRHIIHERAHTRAHTRFGW